MSTGAANRCDFEAQEGSGGAKGPPGKVRFHWENECFERFSKQLGGEDRVIKGNK